MALYIHGIGLISPQQDGSLERLAEPLDYSGDKLVCVEPDYSQFIDIRQLRRMSRVLKMGFAAGALALKDAGVKAPDGIITGTSYGCLDDTGIFLSKMIDNKENALNPTPFIQSTHNTIGSQIALMLQCQGYNQTYTQRAFSFEHSLLDALLEINENPGQSFLVGGVDELTETSHTIQKRFGIFRPASTSSLQLIKDKQHGTLNGEGAAYFLVSGVKKHDSAVSIESLATFYRPDHEELKKGIKDFLAKVSLKPADVDLVLLGKSGDERYDQHSASIASELFSSSTIAVFKHLCGEYPTATAFGMALAARMVTESRIPDIAMERNAGRPLRNVLIYNAYFGWYHSLILLRAC